ncbi:MAG: DUF481 domain-containing protein [Ferruginibacter sp.]
MKIIKKILILALFIFTKDKVNGQVPDSLILKNNQILTGMFLSWQKGFVNFYVLDVGLVNIKIEKIKAVVGNLKEYRIVTEGGQVYYGEMKSNHDYTLTIINDTTNNILFTKIVSIIPFNSKSIKPMSSYIAVGYNYSKSNDIGLINGDFGLMYSFRKLNITGSYNTMVTHNNKSFSRNREYAITDAFIPITNRWQIGSRVIYQRNRQLGLESRYLIAGGIEYDAIIEQKKQLYFITGIVRSEESTINDLSKSHWEIPFFINLQLYKFNNPNFSLYTTQIVYFETGGDKRIRHDGELRMSYKLNKKTSLSTYVYDNYDSSVKPQINNFDYGWVFGLRVDF